ncbi:PTS transporter subunit EIIB [Halanaerobium saccharolyticum]|uniref:PTS transporter subunit EIIB n=1 Tax=Halanaerobium saccharolyticum TaxID=43595 RepID=UPI00283AA3DE|nr:PTS transporter subunit EIIB [Halanaerobium saccharolyticum]
MIGEGADNVSSVTNCMTRLRFVLKDDSIADIEEIESLEGVLRVLTDFIDLLFSLVHDNIPVNLR